MEKGGFVYILASKPYGTLYVGVTSDLPRRVSMHRQDLLEGFTKTYGVHRLVYYERFDDILEAIAFEKRLKRWRRDWKFRIIEERNPYWEDIFPRLGPS